MKTRVKHLKSSPLIVYLYKWQIFWMRLWGYGFHIMRRDSGRFELTFLKPGGD